MEKKLSAKIYLFLFFQTFDDQNISIYEESLRESFAHSVIHLPVSSSNVICLAISKIFLFCLQYLLSPCKFLLYKC